MSYDVGTHIDLAYLNSKIEPAQPAPKRSMIERAQDYSYDTGTQLIFRRIGTQLVAARRIPVAFA